MMNRASLRWRSPGATIVAIFCCACILHACGSDSVPAEGEGTSAVPAPSGALSGSGDAPRRSDGTPSETLPSGLCTSPADCPEGMRCIAGNCSMRCESDADCPDALPYCDSRRDRCGECAENRHCPEGTVCLAQRCAPLCTTDDDCDDETYCDLDTGRCIERECFLDRDCPADTFCDPRSLTCEPTDCGDDGDCDGGRCVDGRCMGDEDCDKRGEGRCIDDATLERCGMNLAWERVPCAPGVCAEGACSEGENACGGSAALDEEPGDPCGFCGTVVCEGGDATRCDEVPLNACGTCGPLPGEVGERCGTCGEFRCDPDAGLVCDDPGANACGACGPLQGSPGDSCGTCGELSCSGDSLSCDDPGRNRCGGCAELSTFPGARCSGSENEVHVCSGNDALTCVADTSGECSNFFSCIQWAERFGVPVTRVGCDPEIGCYMRGACSLIGPTADDPFGSQCRSGTFCLANIPFLPIDAACVGCTPGEGQCRNGEVCIDATGFGIGACVDLLNPPI